MAQSHFAKWLGLRHILVLMGCWLCLGQTAFAQTSQTWDSGAAYRFAILALPDDFVQNPPRSDKNTSDQILVTLSQQAKPSQLLVSQDRAKQFSIKFVSQGTPAVSRPIVLNADHKIALALRREIDANGAETVKVYAPGMNESLPFPIAPGPIQLQWDPKVKPELYSSVVASSPVAASPPPVGRAEASHNGSGIFQGIVLLAITGCVVAILAILLKKGQAFEPVLRQIDDNLKTLQKTQPEAFDSLSKRIDIDKYDTERRFEDSLAKFTPVIDALQTYNEDFMVLLYGSQDPAKKREYPGLKNIEAQLDKDLYTLDHTLKAAQELLSSANTLSELIDTLTRLRTDMNSLILPTKDNLSKLSAMLPQLASLELSAHQKDLSEQIDYLHLKIDELIARPAISLPKEPPRREDGSARREASSRQEKLTRQEGRAREEGSSEREGRTEQEKPQIMEPDTNNWRDAIPFFMDRLATGDNSALQETLATMQRSFLLLTTNWEETIAMILDPNRRTRPILYTLDLALYFDPSAAFTTLIGRQRDDADKLFAAWKLAQDSRREDMQGMGLRRMSVTPGETMEEAGVVDYKPGPETSNPSLQGTVSHVEPGDGGYMLNGMLICPTTATFYRILRPSSAG